jgi:hypothetical protein
MTLVNLGCGATIHPAWVNLDLSPLHPSVTRWDARRGLPFAGGVVDACYASHVLEHMDCDQGSRLLAECFRVLKPGGIARIVIPDLEVIARLYLENLASATAGSRAGEARYDWMILELLDQMTRGESGGRMARYLATGRGDDTMAFVRSRTGDDVCPAACGEPVVTPSTRGRHRRRLRLAFRRARERVLVACAGLLLGPRGADAVRTGVFRASGEVHVWMYDRFSLVRALRHAGFSDVRCRSAGESAIPGFATFQLEEIAGKPRKPDSLYVEGVKPGSAPVVVQ